MVDPIEKAAESSPWIELHACRGCSKNFRYSIPGGGDIEIIAGIPPSETIYKAISHVWGPQNTVKFHCQQCSKIWNIRLRSQDTFRNVMTLAGAGSSIWMDNMSINQEDPSDLATQVAVMGRIYGNAKCVAVILPASDAKAFDRISSIVATAQELLDRKSHFDFNTDENDNEALKQHGGLKKTEQLVQDFIKNIEQLQDNIDKYEYWSRAWTFQEWTSAFDVDIGLDLPSHLNSIPRIIQKVKSTVVHVAIMIADYKLRNGQHTEIDIGWSRGFAKPFLDKVKRLFPFEDAFAVPEEIDEKELWFQTAMPNEGTNALLGLRPTPRKPRTPQALFRARLCLMLDSFSGMNERKATFAADLVCCWASMCNIEYGYSKSDRFPIALTKVIRAIRSRGVKIYNFNATSQFEQDVDMSFYSYAAEHSQSNASNQGHFPGLPIMTARTDTLRHFCTAIKMCNMEFPSRPSLSGRVTVNHIKGAKVRYWALLQGRPWSVLALRCASSGIQIDDPFLFTDPFLPLFEVLKQISDAELTQCLLVVVDIPFITEDGKSRTLHAWAICSASRWLEHEIFVGRETLNNTLVLATPNSDTPGLHTILAYLVLSDNQCGSFLIPVANDGSVDLTFHTPQRSDAGHSEYLKDRILRGKVSIGKNTDPPPLTWCLLRQDKADRMRNLHEIQSAVPFGNNDVIQKSGTDWAKEFLVEVIKRHTGPASFERGPKGRHPLDIDIGHPELISQEQEALNLKKHTERLTKRRLSLDSQVPRQ